MNEHDFEALHREYEEALMGQYLGHPELHGKAFRPKDFSGASMAFSVSLLDFAGGYWRLMRDWEPDERFFVCSGQ